MSTLRTKKRKLQNELDGLQRKESKSMAYKKRATKTGSSSTITDGVSGKGNKQIDVMLKRKAADNDEVCIVATKMKPVVVEIGTQESQETNNDDGRVEETSDQEEFQLETIQEDNSSECSHSQDVLFLEEMECLS